MTLSKTGIETAIAYMPKFQYVLRCSSKVFFEAVEIARDFNLPLKVEVDVNYSEDEWAVVLCQLSIEGHYRFVDGIHCKFE